MYMIKNGKLYIIQFKVFLIVLNEAEYFFLLRIIKLLESKMDFYLFLRV